ncbi:MAG: hypothetical protein UV20_C0035G0009 [Candidatus Magasanikbacteria bacterium GW2011_GWA2_42_32]|uniref:Uncharacterized protein n=1 Tax=Candidatus Magasanikbacteria bacterium GW2011_GWA2_42_32 TaxID=1619039 RepID=A0A0G1C6M7_9BACT|nr:MAG: hypothetical protein UV20_C0035G0009 [Candidatus Magasanikbacteria bacterium GW2011_GWA2_42_32]
MYICEFIPAGINNIIIGRMKSDERIKSIGLSYVLPRRRNGIDVSADSNNLVLPPTSHRRYNDIGGRAISYRSTNGGLSLCLGITQYVKRPESFTSVIGRKKSCIHKKEEKPVGVILIPSHGRTIGMGLAKPDGSSSVA